MKYPMRPPKARNIAYKASLGIKPPGEIFEILSGS
jgi:hypothetical protein